MVNCVDAMAAHLGALFIRRLDILPIIRSFTGTGGRALGFMGILLIHVDGIPNNPLAAGHLRPARDAEAGS